MLAYKDIKGDTALDLVKLPFKKIKQELNFYAAVQKNPTLTNLLRKKAYQEHVKGNPVLLQLLLGFDSRMQDEMDEHRDDKNNPLSLTFQIEKNRLFFSNMLGDDAFDLRFLETVEPMKRLHIQEQAKRELEQLKCKSKEREMENMERLRIQEQTQCEFESLKCEFEKIRRSTAPVVDQVLRASKE